MSVTFLLCLRNRAGEARNVGECSYGTNQYFDYLPTEEQDDYDSDEDFDYLPKEDEDKQKAVQSEAWRVSRAISRAAASLRELA